MTGHHGIPSLALNPVARVVIVPYEGGRMAKVIRALDEGLDKESWIARVPEGALLYDQGAIDASVAAERERCATQGSDAAIIAAARTYVALITQMLPKNYDDFLRVADEIKTAEIALIDAVRAAEVAS